MAAAPKLIRSAPDRPRGRTAGIQAFLVVRNESLRLPAVLDHHRRAGVDRFFAIDNGSTDGTTEFLGQQPDVDLYWTDASYAESRFGLDWIHPLLDEFATGRWALTIDADELFVHPLSEQMDLRDFCAVLDGRGIGAVCAIMLDMYSDGPIAQAVYAPGASLLETCPFFDSGPYDVARSEVFPRFELRGGARSRFFCDGDGGVAPTVSKIPLVRWQPTYRYVSSTHYMDATPSLCTMMGALLHFKFLSDFRLRAADEAARSEHFAAAREYKRYVAKLAQDASSKLHHAGSIRYEGTRQLLDLDIRNVLRAATVYVKDAGAVVASAAAARPQPSGDPA
jgi:hypothetical protein